MGIILFNLVLLVAEILCVKSISVSSSSPVVVRADLYSFVVKQRVNCDGGSFVVRCICFATELRPSEDIRVIR
jgi:hypothetical protein